MPDARLIDTNILVYLTRRDPALAALVAAYRPHVEGYDGVITFVTLGELRRWPVQEGWRAERVAALERFISRFAVYHTDDDLCRVWGRLIGTLARAGRTLSMADSWIAATALVLDIPLVTHNRRHFEGISGLTVIAEAL
jgi:predicted nucleic acid-binding protein